MDASIIQARESIQKILKEAGLTFEDFKPKEVHPDIKNACLLRIKESSDIFMIYNLAKIAKLSKDEVREHVCKWILDENHLNFSNLSKEELEMVLELV